MPRPGPSSSGSVVAPRARFRAARATLGLALLLAACGEGRSTAPELLEGPADAARFEGQGAVFQVWASGTEGLTYQWRRDGVPIAGARDSHLVVATTALADDGARFSVEVTNGGDAPLVSPEARLTVYPPLDLRFQWVGAPYAPTWTLGSNLLSGWSAAYAGKGSPLSLEAGWCTSPEQSCSWSYAVAQGVPGMAVTYTTQPLADPPRWAELPGTALVTSLDLLEGPGLLAAAVTETSQRGEFTPVVEGEAAPADLQAIATAEAAAGRVITAASYRGGRIHWVSYGWSLRGETTYEAQVALDHLDTVEAAAAALAARGYVLTAVGSGNGGADGFVLVGTRVAGSAAARPFTSFSAGEWPAGYQLLGWLQDPGAQRAVLLFEQ